MAGKMTGTSLEDLQERVSTFRLRAEPGLTTADHLARLDQEVFRATHRLGGVGGEALGEMLCDLLCLARAERLDLAYHTKRALDRMRREYGEE